MNDTDKHILVTCIGGLAIGILVAVALRLQGVDGGEAFCGVALAGFCGGLAAGIGKEYGDECAEGNNWDWDDVLYDVLGGIVGASIVCLTLYILGL